MQKNMTKGKQGTRQTRNDPSATVPKWPSPRSGKKPDNARKDIAAKANLLDKCIKACFANMRQCYDGTWSGKFHDKLDEDNDRALDLRSEIKAIMDELHNPSPEEYAAYKQISAAVENLLAVRYDFNCTREVAADELRADAKREKDARRKAEETAKVKAATKAKAKAEEAELKAEEEARLKAEKAARLKIKAGTTDPKRPSPGGRRDEYRTGA